MEHGDLAIGLDFKDGESTKFRRLFAGRYEVQLLDSGAPKYRVRAIADSRTVGTKAAPLDETATRGTHPPRT
jgi:hypothetical protein